MAIEPISMPNSAAINFGENDVRHLTEGDALDVAGVSRPTRHLAQRDVALADKLNEVVEAVNNKDQFVPLPVLRTVLPPNSEEIIQNFRIPPGFECRVLNAIVTSLPASSSAELDIYYTAYSFGNSTGAQVVTTSTEYSGGTLFYANGEFVITLKNRGGATLELIASILLTMRPVGSTSSYLLASALVGEPGRPGQPGRKGDTGGSGGAGPAGTPGLVWMGDYSASTTYNDKAVVAYANSSWKSKHTSNTGNTPAIGSIHWDLVAKEGDPGFDWKGAWSNVTNYVENDGVSYLGSSYVCVVASSLNRNPVAYPSDWNLVAQAGVNGFRYRGTWGNPPLDNPAVPYVLNDAVTRAVGSETPSGVATMTIVTGTVTLSTTGFLTGTVSDVGRYLRATSTNNSYQIIAAISTTQCTVSPAASVSATTFVLLIGAVAETYVAVVAAPVAVQPPPSTDWEKLFSSSANAFSISTIPGKIYVEANYQAAEDDGPYTKIDLAYPGTATVNFTEFKVNDSASGHGMVFLKYSRLARWTGALTVVLPQITDGATVNWAMTDVVLGVTNAGPHTTYGTVSSGLSEIGHAVTGTFINTWINPFGNKVTLSNQVPGACSVSSSVLGLQTY
jgi:hypothetical protein